MTLTETQKVKFTQKVKSTGPTIVEIDDLVKNYYTKAGTVEVLKGITMTVHQSEFLGVIGPSGSGKTTLMSIIGSLMKPTEGTVVINGTNIGTLSKNQLADFRLKNIGFVFQSNNLVPTLTALENVEIPLILAKVPAAERKTRATELLEKVGLGNKLDNMPDELSGGEKHRISIARALINNPELILADEPTGNLDSMTGREIIHLLKDLTQQEKTILVVSHDPTHLPEFDRVIKLVKGHVEEVD